MNVMVLGASSYLGSRLIKKLESLQGYKIFTFNRHDSLQDLDSLPPMDYVLNFVVNYGKKGESLEELIKINVEYPFEIIKKLKAKTILNVSTVLNQNLSPYAATKKQLEQKLKDHFHHSSTQVLNLWLHHFYGPDLPAHNFIGFLIYEMSVNHPIDLSLGTQKRDFIYLDDLLHAMVLLMQKASNLAQYAEVEIGSGESVAIKDLVELLKKKLNSQSELNFGALPLRKNEPQELKSANLFLTQLGWRPLTTLQEGLDLMLAKKRLAPF